MCRRQRWRRNHSRRWQSVYRPTIQTMWKSVLFWCIACFLLLANVFIFVFDLLCWSQANKRVADYDKIIACGICVIDLYAECKKPFVSTNSPIERAVIGKGYLVGRERGTKTQQRMYAGLVRPEKYNIRRGWFEDKLEYWWATYIYLSIEWCSKSCELLIRHGNDISNANPFWKIHWISILWALLTERAFFPQYPSSRKHITHDLTRIHGHLKESPYFFYLFRPFDQSMKFMSSVYFFRLGSAHMANTAKTRNYFLFRSFELDKSAPHKPKFYQFVVVRTISIIS